MYDSSRRFPLAGIGMAFALLAFATTGVAAQGDAVVATVNGEPVTEAEVSRAESDLSQQFAQLPPEQRRAAALSALIEIRLMADEARKQEIDQSEEFQQRMAFLRERALHSAYIEEEIAPEINDDSVRARYDQEISQTPPVNEIRARHILVETEEEANAIIEQLNEGGDFEAIAKEKSQDGAAQRGGDLGYFQRGQMVPPFEEAAFALEVGEYTSEPVETQFGWHVIKLEDRRAQQPPAFEEVKEQLRSAMMRETYRDRVSELREAAEIEIEDSELKQAVEGLQQPPQPAE